MAFRSFLEGRLIPWFPGDSWSCARQTPTNQREVFVPRPYAHSLFIPTLVLNLLSLTAVQEDLPAGVPPPALQGRTEDCAPWCSGSAGRPPPPLPPNPPHPRVQGPGPRPLAWSPRPVLGGHPGGCQAAVGWAWAAAPTPGEVLIPFLLQKEIPLTSKDSLSSLPPPPPPPGE